MFAASGRESSPALVAGPKTLPLRLVCPTPAARVKSTVFETTSSDAGPTRGEGSFELGHSPPGPVSEESVLIDIVWLPFCGEPDNVHWTFRSPPLYKSEMQLQGNNSSQ
jgi:hypothetical protein